MANVYIDESGFTGKALLDPQQPHFVLASSTIGDEEAKDLLYTAFPKYKGQEFKFQKIWRQPKSRQRLLSFLETTGKRHKDIYIWAIDKKFCALTKMIDFLMEPTAYHAGYDFYENAHAYKLSNYIHFGLKSIGSEALYDATVNTYFDFARDPSEYNLRRLRYRLTLFANSAPEEMTWFYDACLFGAENFHQFHDMATFKDTSEIYVTSMLNVVGYWSNVLPEKFTVIHDQSNSFLAEKELWDAITSPTVPPQFHASANGPGMNFPLPLLLTMPGDSKSSFAIQLCDMLAGFSAKCSERDNLPDEDEFFKAVLNSEFGNIPLNGVNPGLEFPDGPPAPRRGPDAVDLMTGIIKAGKKK